MDPPASNVAFDPHHGVDANLARFVAYCLATSLGWDLGRAVVTAVLTLIWRSPDQAMAARSWEMSPSESASSRVSPRFRAIRSAASN
jgi:hypothetical protein